ncbi:alpha/beta fold hydrolase [Mesorhizobium xinjiangense]|uniref:alpha/beta fold hydrolase n=1 Tax=Mesorhizobium xinjiangense TaxID=2678685 RepID=UPI0012ED3375|nr:alpha/beta hydrolase [Mesorhizobium xinjiangense]
MTDANRTFEHFFYTARDGLRLHARIYRSNNPAALPAICLAGLTRNARDFHELALHLSQKVEPARDVIAFDYRGRGQSDYDGNWRNYDVPVEADDILAGLTAAGVAHGHFIGTSRGGLIIHTLAGIRPGVLRSAVLNDIGPEIEAAGLAQIRAYLERAPEPKTIAEAVAIQKKAVGDAFPALTDEDWHRMMGAFYDEKDGRLVAAYDPALLKSLNALDLSQPLPSLWPQFMGLGAIPVMAIRGANSSLLSAETLARMQKDHPGLEVITVEGQGHAPLLETAGLPERIADFLARAER